MKTQLAIFLALVGGALAQQSQVSTSTTWCATRPVVVVDGNYEFYGADCITLMRCPTNSIVLAGYDSKPTPQQFPTGIEAAEITLNPYLDGHGYQFRRDSDGVIIGVESHSTKKTKAEIDAGEKAISDARKADRELIIKLIERRMDTINTNNLVTTAQGRFTVFSATMEQVKGGIATVKGTARWRGVTVDATVSNSCTFQVWTAQNAKAGVETNNWTITLWK